METRSLAATVNARLLELGISALEGAQRTGLSYRHFNRILHEEGYSPRGTTLEKLAKLGIPMSTLALAAFCTPPTVSVA